MSTRVDLPAETLQAAGVKTAEHPLTPSADARARAPHIVAVDDDPSVRQMIADYLADNELRVTALASGREIAPVMAREAIDLVLLDLRLPGEDGMQIARRLREESDVPIIIHTACKDAADRVMGLELGADDYLIKPCSPREMLARIRAVLRRCRVGTRPACPKGLRGYRFGGWELNLNTRRLTTSDGQQQALSMTEVNLLVALLGSSPRILTRDQLVDLSRLHNDEIFPRSIDVQMMRLRRKIESDRRNPRYIRTERGEGYFLGVPVEPVY